jgi:tRNA/rRNA methyltransferase
MSAPPIIILVRPQLGENIGKAARAMLNFGLTEMRLVAPRDGWPNPSAGPAASGADIVLANAQVYDTLAEATADISHIYATTVRKRGVTKPVITPEEAAREVLGNAGRSAILFGAERSGLESDEVTVARAIITVPINPDFGSLNLAQAVILCAYEWSKTQNLASPPKTELDPPASQFELDGLIQQLDDMLDPLGYFRPEDRSGYAQDVAELAHQTGLERAGSANIAGCVDNLDQKSTNVEIAAWRSRTASIRSPLNWILEIPPNVDHRTCINPAACLRHKRSCHCRR